MSLLETPALVSTHCTFIFSLTSTKTPKDCWVLWERFIKSHLKRQLHMRQRGISFSTSLVFFFITCKPNHTTSHHLLTPPLFDPLSILCNVAFHFHMFIFNTTTLYRWFYDFVILLLSHNNSYLSCTVMYQKNDREMVLKGTYMFSVYRFIKYVLPTKVSPLMVNVQMSRESDLN